MKIGQRLSRMTSTGAKRTGAEVEALHVLGVDVDVGGETEAFEALGEGNLVHAHRLLVAVDLGHLVPVVLKGLGGDQGAAVGVEVGLEVAGEDNPLRHSRRGRRGPRGTR